MNFSERFASTKGLPIMVDGRRVHAMLSRVVVPGEQVTLVWQKARSSPVQGVRLKLLKGALGVAAQELDDVVLWSDSTPEKVVMRCLSKKPAELRVWNCWRDDQGIMQAWIGNAGMLIEDLGEARVRIRCNSRPEVTFDDLVFDLVFQPPG